eukprot:Platyproteum_vivax@DN4747_c0_g1_i1.p1
MMRNFLLLSLLVVACYANRAILRTGGGKVADVYTMWRYGSKNEKGNWVESRIFSVKFQDVQNSRAFSDEFKKKGNAIAQEYNSIMPTHTKSAVVRWIYLEFNGVLMDPEGLTVYGTINLSDNESFQINKRSFELKDTPGPDIAHFLYFIRSKATSILQECEK